ncbi:transcriptional antiterminator [Scopulibacillus darangshiensis]|uniref:Ascorbate-specific PTS system EIIA component n=1 Tax=Scopulibacillus darangshiensis TaxID=442528 RepID=A0A4R2P2B4_9BACL|nr:BglG family transcription antiterminator [Scopulibacillus darangshiensis]TCP27835.1 transcriptional antiterminator [Scopulibacillus darangshiensis]
MLDQRPLSLLGIIARHRRVTIKQLIDRTNLTRRQVEYDLQKVNDWLTSYGCEPIVNKRAVGLVISKKVQELAHKKVHLSKKGFPALTEEVRTLCIPLYIFIRKEELSLFHLTSFIQMSKNTVIQDIKNINEFASVFNISIKYNRHNGYFIEGIEANKRAFIMKCICLILKQQNGKELIQRLLECNGKYLYDTFYKCIKLAARKFQLSFVDQKIEELSCFLNVLHEHIHIYQSGDLVPKGKDKFKNKKEFKAAEYLIQQLDFQHNEDEICYLTAHLLGLSLGNIDEQTDDNKVFKSMVEKIVLEFEKRACISFDHPEMVMATLYKHLRPAYYRLLFRIPITNPLLEQVKTEYYDLFVIVRGILKPFESMLGSEVPEDEIGYITIHFGALLKNTHTTRIQRKKAVIVCPNGVGSSIMLKEELIELFPELSFISLLSMDEFQNKEVPNHDLVFSTIFFKTNKPLFVVNPIMSTLEKANTVKEVYSVIHGIYTLRPNQDQLIKIIREFAEIRNESGLKKALNKLLEGETIDTDGRSKPVLSDLITEETVTLINAVNNWEEAIKLSAEPLLINDFISHEYIQAMIDNVKKFGPYIIVAPEIALPHARPECGVKQIGMSLLRINESVDILNDKKNKVRLLICIAAIDNSTHLKALAQLTKVLSDKSNRERLLSLNSKDQIIDYIYTVSQ